MAEAGGRGPGAPRRPDRGDSLDTGPHRLVAARFTVDAVVPFEVVGDELRTGTVVRAAHGGQAAVIHAVDSRARYRAASPPAHAFA